MRTEEHGQGRRGQGRRGQEWALNLERKGRSSTTATDREVIRGWFVGALVDGWFVGEAELTIDDYEIYVVGNLPPVQVENASDESLSAAEAARIERFREDTRERRIEIASEAEARFGRKVAWGAKVGSTSRLFTTVSVPVMTRLQLRQRRVLDTLVEAGVARSRSEALAWCVELVGRNEEAWISRLREALDTVENARAEGPSSSAGE
ncbi:MAG: hypothetical protein JWM85_1814 [Acidimicrobiaceae bacterium]|nr:hypothetical protein [Acidimicrobiaceae bacterium]